MGTINPVTAQVSFFALAARELITKTVAYLLSRIIQDAVIWTDVSPAFSLSFLFMVSPLIFLAASCLLVDADCYSWCGIRCGEKTLSNAIITASYGIGITTLILYIRK